MKQQYKKLWLIFIKPSKGNDTRTAEALVTLIIKDIILNEKREVDSIQI